MRQMIRDLETYSMLNEGVIFDGRRDERVVEKGRR